MVRVLVRKGLFIVLGAVLLCLPAAAFAEPLDSGLIQAEAETVSEAQTIDAPHLSKDVASLDKELLVSIGHDAAILAPNAPYEIFLDDVSLGTYTSDYSGQLFVQVKLPVNIEPGLRILKVTDHGMTHLQKILTILL